MSGHVDWQGDELALLVENASDEILTRLAFQVEGEYKVRAAVDTGFMRNSAYAITPLANRRAQAVLEAAAAADRDLAPMPQVDDGEAAVHVAAEYAMYQEMRDGALYQAVQAVGQQAGGVIRAVGREKFG